MRLTTDYGIQMRQKILITGATGFVGRQIINSLQNSDVDLHIIVRKSSKGKIPTEHKFASVIYTDDLFSENSDWWLDKCSEIDIVVHAAWYAEPGSYLNSDRNIACLIGSLSLAHGAIKAGVRRFVGIGSCLEYDPTDGYLSVDTPLKPYSLYASTKSSLYMTLTGWFKEVGVEFCWCRLFYLFGEGDSPKRLWGYISKNLENKKPVGLTEGNQIRDYIDVGEAANLIVEKIFSNYVGAANICSGVPITVRELATGLAEKLGGEHLLNFGVKEDRPDDPNCIVGIK